MKKLILTLVACLCLITLQAEIRLANIFADNMVLQAHKPIKIWGSAAVGETVKVFLNEDMQQTIADKEGHWTVEFPPMDYGDTFALKAMGLTSKIEIKIS